MAEEKFQHTEETPEPSSTRLIFTLSLAGFISGLVLVAAYVFTKPMIEQNKAEALRAAIYKVLPGTVEIKTLELKENILQDFVEQKSKSVGGSPEKIYLGSGSAGELIGFAIPGEEPGFQDIIGIIYGFNADKNLIIGFEVLECKETPGLGDKIFKDMSFVNEFKALLVEPVINMVKKGAKLHPNEVEAITGATISSRAVVRLLNKSMDKWKIPVENYMKDYKTSHPD